MIRRKFYGYMTYLQSMSPVTRSNIIISPFDFAFMRHLNYNDTNQRGLSRKLGKVEKSKASTKSPRLGGWHEEQDVNGVARV